MYSVQLPKIPCLFLSYSKDTDRIVLYFHSNSTDLGIMARDFHMLAEQLECHVMFIEYPGYGVYPQRNERDEAMCEDALSIFDLLTKKMKLRGEQIIVIGRSIGSGVATYLAHHRKVQALILISPFLSIKSVAKSLAGPFGWLLHDRFKNYEEIAHITSPILCIHGKSDDLIPISHSVELLKKAVNSKYKAAHFDDKMTHTVFRMYDDLIIPVREFLTDIGVYSEFLGRMISEDEFLRLKN